MLTPAERLGDLSDADVLEENERYEVIRNCTQAVTTVRNNVSHANAEDTPGPNEMLAGAISLLQVANALVDCGVLEADQVKQLDRHREDMVSAIRLKTGESTPKTMPSEDVASVQLQAAMHSFADGVNAVAKGYWSKGPDNYKYKEAQQVCKMLLAEPSAKGLAAFACQKPKDGSRPAFMDKDTVATPLVHCPSPPFDLPLPHRRTG